jgi:hypothetical protein
MKLTIPKPQLVQIQSRRDEIDALLGEILKSDSAAAALLQRKESLESELVGLEKSSSPDDEDAIEKIGGKRIKLDLVRNKIHALPAQAGQPDRSGALSELLRHLTVEIHQGLTPCFESAVAKLSKAFLPFSLNDANARAVARQTDAIKDMARRMFPRFGENFSAVFEAHEAIKLCDAILAGELAVKFDAQLA